MTARQLAWVRTLAVIAFVVALAVVFPSVLRIIEAAARQLRVLWWVVLVLLLSAWLIWGLGRKR